MDKTVSCGLKQYTCARRYTGKAKIAVRDIHLQTTIRGIGNAVCKVLEFLVELMATAALLLLEFDLVFVASAVAALAVTSFVKLHIRRFTVELDITRLALANEHRGFEMEMDDGNQLVIARLVEEVLDVIERDIDLLVLAQRRHEPQTVLVDCKVSRQALTLEGWPGKHFREGERARFC